MFTEVYSFPIDHPSANGHFPGNPIIPGALLLGMMIKLIEKKLNLPLSTCNIKAAKFFNPVRPGDLIKIEFMSFNETSIKFFCMVDEKKSIGR